MCQCTPNMRTPFCGRGTCIYPAQWVQAEFKHEPQDELDSISKRLSENIMRTFKIHHDYLKKTTMPVFGADAIAAAKAYAEWYDGEDHRLIGQTQVIKVEDEQGQFRLFSITAIAKLNVTYKVNDFSKPVIR